MDDKKLTYEEKQQEKKRKAKIAKDMIVANCNRIVDMLEHNADENVYGYGEYPSSELFNKMHELRRDTINLEKIRRSY